MNKTLAMALLGLGLMACGGDGASGVSGNKRISELSASEAATFCDYAGDVGGPERTIDCGDGSTVTTGGGDVAECIDDLQGLGGSACEATVAQAEACFEDIADLSDEALCNFDLPLSCAPLFNDDCAGS